MNSFLTFCSFLHRHQIVRQYKSFNKVDAGGKWLEIKDVRGMSLLACASNFIFTIRILKKEKVAAIMTSEEENSVQSLSERARPCRMEIEFLYK